MDDSGVITFKTVVRSESAPDLSERNTDTAMSGENSPVRDTDVLGTACCAGEGEGSSGFLDVVRSEIKSSVETIKTDVLHSVMGLLDITLQPRQSQNDQSSSSGANNNAMGKPKISNDKQRSLTVGSNMIGGGQTSSPQIDRPISDNRQPNPSDCVSVHTRDSGLALSPICNDNLHHDSYPAKW